MIFGNPKTNNANSPTNVPSQNKLDELGFKQVPFSRHASEEEFKKYHSMRLQSHMISNEQAFKSEEEHHNKNGNQHP